MKASSKGNFEQQWKRKFEKASVPPPDELWGRIEADLDNQKKRIPFFLTWGLPAYVTSGIAATLLLVLGGWLLFSNSEEKAVAEMAKVTEPILVESEEKSTELVQPKKQDDFTVQETINNSKNLPNKSNKPTIADGRSTATVGFATPDNQPQFPNDESNSLPLTDKVALTKSNTRRTVSHNPSTFSGDVANQLSKLIPHQYEEYPVRYILTRNKLAYYEPITETENTTKQKHRSWIGLVSGLSPFKPNFQNGGLNQLASANAASFLSNDANFTTQRRLQGTQGPAGPQGGNNSKFMPNTGNSAFNIPTVSPVQQFANGRAFNFGIQAGRQVTKRLALELGVRYIQGNSPVNTNVYTLNERTGEINTFVQDYLTQGKTLSNAVVTSAETLKNSYEYLSLPLQLAYEIPLFNKLNLEITGGVSADMFLQNTLQSEMTDVASLNARNSVFRTLGVSGLGGVRFNYLLDEKWELIIGSAFQQALVSNFESGSSAQLRPQMLGINYGVNYHF
jgi:hypothetical protein